MFLVFENIEMRTFVEQFNLQIMLLHPSIILQHPSLCFLPLNEMKG